MTQLQCLRLKTGFDNKLQETDWVRLFLEPHKSRGVGVGVNQDGETFSEDHTFEEGGHGSEGKGDIRRFGDPLPVTRVSPYPTSQTCPLRPISLLPTSRDFILLLRTR